ncbi:MAG: hypothetical protein GX458_22770 [Phyllobacteriaceae bacterium]|nr:hypothetical protein [Phyllobacteriaceae bacterium]
MRSRVAVAPLGAALAMILAATAFADELAPPPDTPARPTYRIAPLEPLPAPAAAPSPDVPAAAPQAAPTPSTVSPATPAPAAAPQVVPPPAGASPDAAGPRSEAPDAAGPRSEAPEAAAPDTAAADPADATEPAAPEPLDGPMRPKDSLAAVPGTPSASDEAWKRSFDGGVRWKKGDTSVVVSGTPATGFRIGGAIAH